MKKSLLLVAILATTVSGHASALTAYRLIQNGQTYTDSNNFVYDGNANFGIYALNSNSTGIFNGEIISTDISPSDAWSVGVYAGKGGKLILGDRTKSSVTIKTTASGQSVDNLSFAVWVDGAENTGGQIEIRGKTIDLCAQGSTDSDVRAIHVATNSLQPNPSSKLILDADSINITAMKDSVDPTDGTSGIVAMSTGEVYVTGNTKITAGNAILVRGNAVVSVNADGKHSTVINGNVNYNFDAPTSGTPVDAKVVLNLVGAESSWTGNTVASWNGDPTPADVVLKVTGMELGLSDGATWTPVATKNDSTTQNNGEKYQALNVLNNNNGNINITGNNIDITIEKMNGTGGSVNLATDLSAEDGKQTGKVHVISSEEGSTLDVKLMDSMMQSKLTSDDLSAEQAKKLLSSVVGDVVTTSTVEEGMYNSGFSINKDGTTIFGGPNSVMQSALELASVTPLAVNRILMNDVRKRLGDIRTSTGTSGVWARYDGGRLSGEDDLENNFNTIQIGIDTVPTPEAIRFGVAFSYTDGEADYARGNADMEAYSLAAYGVWLGDSGQFIDVIARMAVTDTDMTVDGNKKGSTDNVALGLSGEFGWRFDVSKLVYVEPQVELSYTYVNSDKLKLSDGSTYEFDSNDSLIGRFGLALGMVCPNDRGNLYAKISAVHEFLGDASVTGGNGAVYEIDGKDTWVEYGLGANMNLTDSTYVWADVERTSGGVLDEDWRATVGVRYSF